MKNKMVQREPFFISSDDITNMVHITLYPKDLALYWQRCGLTANFGASFAAFCFPQIKNAESALSTILNELVENAVKYSIEESKRIKIILCEMGENLYFEVENYISHDQMNVFDKEIAYLEDCEDISEAYIQAMERSIKGDDSKLGLMTILNDFRVGMSFVFTQKENEPSFRVIKVQVKISPEDIVC